MKPEFSGGYSIEWLSAREYRYIPGPIPLQYTAKDGSVYVFDQHFEFDGASVPRPFWMIPGLSPWDWMPSAIMHDWLYESKHRGNQIVSRSRADALLHESLECFSVNRLTRQLIYYSVRAFGGSWWK